MRPRAERLILPPRASRRRGGPLVAQVLGLCLGLGCTAAMAAAVVNLDTGKSLVLQPGGTGSLTLSLTNAGDASALVNSYSLGLLIVPTSGTDAATFDAWTAPATNPLLSDGNAEYTPSDPPQLFPLNAPVTISGTDYFDYYPVQAANTNGANDPLAPAATRNIGALSFTAGAGTGTWAVYVVNQEPQEGGLPLSFYLNAAFADFGFGNLPAVNGASLLVGTVGWTAVPEPASLGIVGSALLVLFVRRCRGARPGGRPRR